MFLHEASRFLFGQAMRRVTDVRMAMPRNLLGRANLKLGEMRKPQPTSPPDLYEFNLVKLLPDLAPGAIRELRDPDAGDEDDE